MNETTKKSQPKEPVAHIVKRDFMPFWAAWGVRIAALVLALVVSAIVIVLITHLNPLEVYEAMVKGAVGRERRLWVTIRDTMTLLLIGLALLPAFKMKFWNIGAEGQVLIGGLATSAVMLFGGTKLEPWLLMTLMVVASIVAGMLWGIIPAIFKAKWNTNETLFTLMLNYVAIQVVNFCITYWENPAGSNKVGLINSQSQNGWIKEIFGQQYGWNVIIVLGITLLMFVYMKFTKHGYEITVVGESENTAKYAGINVKKVVIRTMAISGALAGLAGFLCVSGADHTISNATAGGRGFTAIVIAWLAQLNPITMLVMAFLIVFLEKGSGQIATQFNLNDNMSSVITGIILFFILGCEFFINYRIQFRGFKQKGEKA